MNTLVVGDIHGCFTELLALLDKAGVGEGDRVLAVGDIVDRGPDSPGVLRFFATRAGAASLMGNHERKHVRWRDGIASPSLAQRAARKQLGESYDDAVSFMARLPLVAQLDEAIVAHAFWEPGVPVGQQRDIVLTGTISGEHYLASRCSRPWYELYDGANPLIVGHRDYLKTGEPLIYRDRVFAIDTGCCVGRALTGMLLPAFRIVSVRSRADYWRQTSEAYTAAQAQTASLWTEEDLVLIEPLCRAIDRERQSIIERLREEPGFDGWTPHQFGARFSELAGSGRRAALLNLSRHNELNADTVRRVLKSPDHAWRLAADLGITATGDE